MKYKDRIKQSQTCSLKPIEGNSPKLGNKPRKMTWGLGNGKSIRERGVGYL